MRRSTIAVAALGIVSARAQGAVSLNLNNATQLQAATSQALRNLLSYYVPNDGGVMDQVQTPWHSSSMMWATFMGEPMLRSASVDQLELIANAS
jgi:hypothetical protein